MKERGRTSKGASSKVPERASEAAGKVSERARRASEALESDGRVSEATGMPGRQKKNMETERCK